MKHPNRLAVLFGSLALVVGTGTATAQSAAAGSDAPAKVTAPRSPNYGTAGLSVYAVSALEFSTYSQSDTWSPVVFTPGRYATAGFFEVPVHLPTGASVERIEIDGCDSSATGSLNGFFATEVGPGGGGTVLVTFDTGSAEMPGCAFFPVDVVPPVTVDARNNVYWFELRNGSTDGTTTYTAARVYYRLQISPAPVTQTFNDVAPGDFGYQYIEALAASGITGGCGGGNYCPNGTLTRAQMAIFLAKALGLYWPN